MTLPFLTNSDAHSLARIGREYNELLLQEPSFRELRLRSMAGRPAPYHANYGLNPLLGKYHRSYCLNCGSLAEEAASTDNDAPICGSPKLVRGVMDRIEQLGARCGPHRFVYPADRPPLRLPSAAGIRAGDRPEDAGQASRAVRHRNELLHDVPEADLAAIAGEPAAAIIAPPDSAPFG